MPEQRIEENDTYQRRTIAENRNEERKGCATDLEGIHHKSRRGVVR